MSDPTSSTIVARVTGREIARMSQVSRLSTKALALSRLGFARF